MIRELLFAETVKARITKPKVGFWKLVGDGVSVYAVFSDGTVANIGDGTPGGLNGYIQYNDNGELGGLATTGTGNVVRATSPTLVTPTLGVATCTSINGTVPGVTGLSLLETTSEAEALTVLGIQTPTTTDRGITKFCWVANRTDSEEGSGTAEDPYHADSASGGIRTLLADATKIPANSYVYLYPGTYVVATGTTLSGAAASGVQLICWPGANLTWADSGNQATDTAAGFNQIIATYNR